MTQLLGHPQVPQVSVVSNVPIELIEQETLNILGINIIDKQDKIDDCIPHGTIRWWVERGESELLGGVSQWGERFDTPFSPIGSYPTLFKAATSFLSRAAVNSAYQQAEALLAERFATAPDYM